MTNEVDDIREIIHVGDLFMTTWDSPMEDGTTIDTYYQVFGVTKKRAKVARVKVPANYDFSKKELLEPYSDRYDGKIYLNKKVYHSKLFGTDIRIGQTGYWLVK